MKHTPLNTPYKIRQDKDYLFRFIIEDNQGLDIGEIESDSVAKGKAVAKHIVHAVNMHEELVSLLKRVVENNWLDKEMFFNEIRTALSQAERK